MNTKRQIVRSSAAVMVILLAGSLAAPPAMAAVPRASVAPSVAWGECPAPLPETAPGLQCALIPVPLDYSEPDGETIEIMLSRLASTAPDARRGVLMLNPGGPGGSGLSMPTDLANRHGLPASVMDTYDLIGMDTRGVGHSTPISCGFTVEQNFTGAVPPYAVDAHAVANQAVVAEGVAEQCAANDVDGHLRHITTANMARDLDQIRIALGEKKASYLGLSYGSALGAAYASMFPDTTDRIILDSNIGDTHLDEDGFRRYGRGAEETFPDFAKWAAERDGSYELGSTPREVRKTYFALAEHVDSNPVVGIDGHLFRQATFAGLYGETAYARTAQTWQIVQRSIDSAEAPVSDEDGEVPAAPGEASPPAEPTGEYELSPLDNSFAVFQAVTCNDYEFSKDVGDYQRAVAEDREQYPVFGAAGANITPCAFWNYEPSEPPVAINDDGPQNILILQNERDPVTPLRGGEMLRDKFEDRSTLVTADRSGHGVYAFGDSPCADEIATRFLVDGTMPRKDVRC